MSSSTKKTPRPRRPSAERTEEFEVRFWGVRGSIPSPGPDTSRYGGNTPCTEVRAGQQTLLFDLGTGAREFGQAATQPVIAHIFLSHYHYDHLQGLPFFGPAFDARSQLVIHGPTRDGRTVREIVVGQMQQPFFPVTAEMVFRAQIEYRPFAAGDRAHVGDALVTAIETHHPGGNLAYRIDFHGRSVVYATDTEHGTDRDLQLIELARCADVFIYDAMYTEAEYLGRSGSPKTGWGHSTLETAVELASAAKVGTLVMFHHEPTRTDDAMDDLVRRARKLRPGTVAAKEGLVLQVRAKKSPKTGR